MFTILRFPGLVLLFVMLVVAEGGQCDAGPATAPASVYDRVVALYFAGNWDELNADLAANVKETSALSAAQKADVDYIRKTVAECRPAWWKTIKVGAPVKFRPLVWGHPINATWEPAVGEPNIHINYVGASASVIFNWNAKDMDDPKIAGEIEFSKGEQVDESLWNALGKGSSWTDIAPRSQINLSEDARMQLSHYLDFRGDVAGAYYTTPRARRWAIWFAISAWSHEYDKDRNQMVRKTVGIFFNEEVLAHPEIYKTVPRPKEPPADGAESKMIWELQEWIRHHDLSLSEDKAFREALRTFAAANELKVRATGKVMLPNGLSFALDTAADKPLAAQRDAWIKGIYAKSTATPSRH